MLTRAGLLPNQLTMPIKQAGITGIDIPNFDPNMNLYAFNLVVYSIKWIMNV